MEAKYVYKKWENEFGGFWRNMRENKTYSSPTTLGFNKRFFPVFEKRYLWSWAEGGQDEFLLGFLGLFLPWTFLRFV